MSDPLTLAAQLRAAEEDITENYDGDHTDWAKIMVRAADRIESLEAERDDWVIERATGQQQLDELVTENRRLREALEPFANPPLYVFDEDRQFVPAPMPEDWIGGGWFSTEDFRRARAAPEAKEK